MGSILYFSCFLSICRVYDVSKHSKYKSGEWSEDRCFAEFLKCFDNPDDVDGVVSSLQIEFEFIFLSYPISYH